MPAPIPAIPVGTKFGDWIVVANSIGTRGEKLSRVRCMGCDNRIEKDIADAALRSGKTNGCGCARGRRLAARGITHGKSKTWLYRLWLNIKYRLKSMRSYEDVELHAEWEHDFEAFEGYINGVLGALPAPDFSLDRIDPFKGYVPGNLRWADKKTQALNRTNAVAVRYREEWNGVRVGAKYGRLTVLELTTDQRNGRTRYAALVKCDCASGSERIVARKNLADGRTRSCGCLKRELLSAQRESGARVTIDGVTDSLIGWARRAGIAPHIVYHRIGYGWDPERAIRTPVRQVAELTVDGITDTVHGWSRRLGVGKYVIQRRIDKGWTAEEAVRTPVRKWMKSPGLTPHPKGVVLLTPRDNGGRNV